MQFSSPVYSVKKNAGYALIPVVRVGGSAQSITNDYYTYDGTASNGVNYVTSSGTLIFTNGQVSQFIHVPIIDDRTNDGPLYFGLALTNAIPLTALGSPNNAVINIIDTESVNETPGSADTTYSSSAGFNNNVYAFALQSNNQLLVGGDFSMANGVPRRHIAR